MRLPRPTAPAAALAATLLAACSGPGEDTRSDRHHETVHAADLAFPLDRYRISDADQHTLEEARDSLITACMARYGLDHTPREPPEPDVPPHTHLYGVDDPEFAAAHGYRHPVDLDPAAYAVSTHAPYTAEQQLVLYGEPQDAEITHDPEGGAGHDAAHSGHHRTLADAVAPTGTEVRGIPVMTDGCHGEAVYTLNDPGPDWVDPTLIRQMENDAGLAADADSRVRDLLGAWSDCMAGHGYRATGPLTAREDLGLDGDPGGPEAVAAAVQDVACKSETGLVTRWAAVDAEYQQRLIAEHAGTLAAYTAQHRERMARARDVLRTS